MTRKYPAVWVRVCELGCALGVERINELSGCWEHQVDENWWLALNGHDEPIRNSKGQEVPDFHIVVEYRGCPAGIFNPSFGEILSMPGDPVGHAEDMLLAALEAAIQKAKES